MYLSTKSATTASGTVTSLDSTSDGTKGHSTYNSTAVIQASTADCTQCGPKHDAPLEFVLRSPSSSTTPLRNERVTCLSPPSFEYVHANVSTSSLSVNANSLLSTIEMEHVTTGAQDNSTGAAQGVNSHVGRMAFNTALPFPIDGGSVKTGSYQVAPGNGETSRVISLPVDPSATYDNTLFPLNPNTSYISSQSQLQTWAYETSPTHQTLAEHLEQTNWEDNTSDTLATSAVQHTPSNALASYEAVMEDEWYILASL